MGSTWGCSPNSTQASGSACQAQFVPLPVDLAFSVVLSCCHPIRHSFAMHPALGGYGYAIRTLQRNLRRIHENGPSALQARREARCHGRPHARGCPVTV